MSSLRNSVQRRSHRERAQPLERARLGLLEKHKDYSLRAKDRKKKQATLKSLREKAELRNEDEFYFGMLSRSGPGTRLSKGSRAAFTGTVSQRRPGEGRMDVDVVRLLKTQDQGYLRTVRNVAAKEVRSLEQRAVMARAWVDGEDEDEEEGGARARKPKKIVFVDDEEEMDAAEAALPPPRNRRGDSDDEDMEGGEVVDEEAEKRARLQATKAERLRARLKGARQRLRALTAAENELELQRARMAKTPTVGGITKKGKKFIVRQRKR